MKAVLNTLLRPYSSAVANRLGLDFPYLIAPESAPTRSDDEARGEPLQVPFKGCGQGLVEIVDIEDEVSLGRGEATEIHQMTVAAGMNIYPAWRRDDLAMRQARALFP